MEYQNVMVINDELDSGEKLIWSGIPRQGILFRSSDIFAIPFSLLWCAFAIFWEISALSAFHKGTSPDANILPIFGIPFVMIGLYLVVGRFIIDSKIRRNTVYGVTDQRIIIIFGLFHKKVKSLNLRILTDVSLEEKSGGNGTIAFGQENPRSSLFGGTSLSGMSTSNTPKFEMIENAKDVYNKIREAQKMS